MDDIKSYGDLTDKELLEFLAEIEHDDDDIQEAQNLALKNISYEEDKEVLVSDDELKKLCSEEFPEEEQENKKLEAFYNGFPDKVPPVRTNDIEEKRLASKRAITQRLTGLKQDRLKIQQEAFNQELIPLSSPIEPENIKLLIALLVSEHTRMVDKYSAYINRRLAILLKPLIPRKLRLCQNTYPNSIRVSPGFLYKASTEYGGGLTFWASPDIPYYFKQNSEQNILQEYKPNFLIKIDIAVKSYYEHLNKRAAKELKYASIIYKKKIKTYFDLLKLNPFWYKLLFTNITK